MNIVGSSSLLSEFDWMMIKFISEKFAKNRDFAVDFKDGTRSGWARNDRVSN
jgi:hypothetical protein